MRPMQRNRLANPPVSGDLNKLVVASSIMNATVTELLGHHRPPPNVVFVDVDDLERMHERRVNPDARAGRSPEEADSAYHGGV